MTRGRVFRWTRGARVQAVELGLTPVEAHVLLLLATYADIDTGEARFCSVERLAIDSGRKVTERRDAAGNSKGKTNSSIAAALKRLEELGLVETTQVGRGVPATRRLLKPADLEPSAIQDGSATPKPSAPQDGFKPSWIAEGSAIADGKPSCPPDGQSLGVEPELQGGAGSATATDPSPLIAGGRTDVAREASHVLPDEDPEWARIAAREELAERVAGLEEATA